MLDKHIRISVLVLFTQYFSIDFNKSYICLRNLIKFLKNTQDFFYLIKYEEEQEAKKSFEFELIV